MFRVREDELLVGRADQEQAAEKDRENQIAAIERALREDRSRSANLLRSLEVASGMTDEFVRDVNSRRVALRDSPKWVACR